MTHGPAGLQGGGRPRGGCAFISYAREDANRIDRLQQSLEEAGVPVWRDTADLWPSEDWRAKIHSAIADSALVFIACFPGRASAGTRATRMRS
jgi:hypothetical protein